jgi:uncharacterized SAM-binding protein YcdF (DUF218 family)
MNRSLLHILRWLAMLPLALAAFVFKFLMAGYGFTALVLLCVIGILLFYNVADLLTAKHPKPVKLLRRIFTVCLCVGLLVVAVTEGFVIHASFGDPEESCRYVVVLGAKVRNDGPSVSLMDRILGAYDYLTAHPEVIAVVSGGQGPDEHITEAQCIYDHLTDMGIDPQRIWIEDQAASTWANLNYSLDLIEAKTGVRPEKLGILSSEYHMLRASMLAKDCGVEPVMIPAKTSLFSQRVNHFMREVAGVWHYILLGGQYD